ncbi:hypothetical protein [Lysinibacillus boronitolerans]|uniref:hypothetical protein n=1 Tax=Lysinibacillus boronitolerans TaxID=309788 RepID=UPI0038555DB7
MTVNLFEVYPLQIKLTAGAELKLVSVGGQTNYSISTTLHDKWMFMAENYTLSSQGIRLSGLKYLRYSQMQEQDVNAKDYYSGFSVDASGTKVTLYRVHSLTSDSMYVSTLNFEVINGKATVEKDTNKVYSFVDRPERVTTGMMPTLLHKDYQSYYIENKGLSTWNGLDAGYEDYDYGYANVYMSETLSLLTINKYNGSTHSFTYRSPDGRVGNSSTQSKQLSFDFNKYKYRLLYRLEDSTYSKVAFAELTEDILHSGSQEKNNLNLNFSVGQLPKIYNTYFEYKVCRMLRNASPTVTVTSPVVNATLYENDTIIIEGTASDADVGNSVTVRYQINANTARAIKAFLSDGTTIEAFSKSLRFSGGSLYDGETLIASGLTDGVAHKLKVWATDDQGGQSTIVERDFYVVPNRAPSLTVEPPVISGNIDNDKFTVNGSYNDADGNTTTIKYRVNGGNSVQVASGTSGVFDFELSIGQLIAGPNTIVVEAVDSYGSKTSKTIKLNKNVVSTEQLRSTVRYKIIPPNKSAQAVLLWIERDKNLAIEVAISMTMAGEAEAFVPVTTSESVPIANGSTTYEDTFFYESDSAKDNIIVQIDMTRQSVDADDNITLISGVLE